MIRTWVEKKEDNMLSPYAVRSSQTKGRLQEIPPCDIRTEFQRDRDRIIHSKAFRRLKHKTQVFIAPAGDHYRTRLTHTLEVSQIARTAARGLRLNEDLVEAISLGHDLGHTPFGHAGEEALNRVYSGQFKHNLHSLRVVDHIEKLNLTHEVRDGIRSHTGDKIPETLEGQIVRIADRIAYINHDIDDAVRAEIIKKEDLPHDSLSILGATHSQRIDTMVRDLIHTSWNNKIISQDKSIEEATDKLRTFLFDKVYIGSLAKTEESKAQHLIINLFKHYLENEKDIPREFRSKERNADREQIIIDYIAGMSDRYAMKKGQNLFIPTPWIE